MADEVYKILQSRLRRNAQQRTTTTATDCSDDCRKPNCHQKSVSTTSESESQSGHKRRRQTSTAGEDPQSHKIIEKRRRDRMNSCLADLSHLIPSNYLKKGRGRIEKTEIVEMAIKHIKYLHSILPDSAIQQEGNETASQASSADTSTDPVHFGRPTPLSWRYPDDEESFKNGYNECKSEALHFLVNSGGIQPESPICTRLVDYLKGYLDHRGSHKQCKTEQMGLVDSDYSSLRSDHSTTNSEVGSIVSNTSGSVVSNTSLSSSFFSQPPSKYSMYLPSTSDKSTKSSKSSSSQHNHHHHHQGHSTSIYPKSGASSSEYPKSSGGYYQGNPSSSSSDHSQSEKQRKSSEDMSSGKFKFKDSIRERYVNAADETESSLLASQKEEKYSTELKHRSDTNAETTDKKTTYPPVEIDWPKEMKKGSIPTFALHGSHYIPVPVAEEVIQPYIHLFERGTPDTPLMLHPITIPVNFCGPIQMAAKCKPPSSSSSTPSKGSHSSSGSKRHISGIKDDKD